MGGAPLAKARAAVLTTSLPPPHQRTVRPWKCTASCTRGDAYPCRPASLPRRQQLGMSTHLLMTETHRSELGRHSERDVRLRCVDTASAGARVAELDSFPSVQLRNRGGPIVSEELPTFRDDCQQCCYIHHVYSRGFRIYASQSLSSCINWRCCSSQRHQQWSRARMQTCCAPPPRDLSAGRNAPVLFIREDLQHCQPCSTRSTCRAQHRATRRRQ